MPSPPLSKAHQFIGQLLDGRYRIEGIIGAGGMGTVYRAKTEDDDNAVAIKVLEIDLTSVDKDSLIQRFGREAQTTSMR
jgi:serine/threonine protein kinase